MNDKTPVKYPEKVHFTIPYLAMGFAMIALMTSVIALIIAIWALV